MNVDQLNLYKSRLSQHYDYIKTFPLNLTVIPLTGFCIFIILTWCLLPLLNILPKECVSTILIKLSGQYIDYTKTSLFSCSLIQWTGFCVIIRVIWYGLSQHIIKNKSVFSFTNIIR